MTDSENFREKRRKWREEWRRNHPQSFDGKGHIWAGVLIVLIGIALLLPLTADVRNWVISWPMLLIVMGLFIGLRHGFRGPAWLILILVGGTFLIEKIDPSISFREYLVPAILISIGLLFIFRPRRNRYCGPGEPKTAGLKESSIQSSATANPALENKFEEKTPGEKNYPQDYIDSTSIFGGIKKNVLSKNFKGGDIVNIFGGSEINLGQADIKGRVELEVTQIFGGTKLVVPSNWEVKPEMTALFGGIEDKRDVGTASNPDKVLVLRGTSIFAGIEIKSF
jgi:predicted membrane protein